MLQDFTYLSLEPITIKIDKITVWDSGPGKDGSSSTANFMKGLVKSTPPLHDLARQAGIELPAFLGELNPTPKSDKEVLSEEKHL